MEKKQELIEALAEHDEEFMGYYLESLEEEEEEGENSELKKKLQSQLFPALQRSVKQRKVIPVLCGSAIKGL
ncbi:hypothetical protein, partial [Shewanella algae]|uniref:hypothetical protein n=1 Tax=Shewanella algae TaxID=38313 RepID=UPI00313CADBB